mgnify:FL=1
MRKKTLILLILSTFLNAEEFISKQDYAKLLYINPRGISCAKCHGFRGESRVIATYSTYNKTTKQLDQHKLIAPAINTIGFEEFKAVFNSPRKFMPTYFLTEGEIEALYEYVSRFSKN